MNWNAMRLALVVPLSFLLSGCPNALDKFSGETVVNLDGSVTRTTRYVANTKCSTGKIKERYLLPPGGAWQCAKRTEDSEDGAQHEVDTQSYELVAHYKANEPIPSDFIQPGTLSAKAAHNQISVRAQRYWLMDTFKYEERFRDVVTEEGFSSAIQKLYTSLVEPTGLGLSQIPHVEMTAETAQVKLRTIYDPMIEQYLAIFAAKCMSPGTTMESCVEALDQSTLVIEIDDDDLLVERIAAIFPAPPVYRDDEWVVAISEAVNDSIENSAFSEIFEAEEEELLGVSGFNLLGSDAAPLEIRLSLPGELVTNNAHEHESGKLVWRFKDEDFIYKEYFLHAESRIIHYERIVLALIVLIVFLVILRSRTQAQDLWDHHSL